MSLGGYAHLTAHNVFNIGGEARNRGGSTLQRSFDGGHQKYLALIAIVYNCPATQTHGLGPLNRAGRKARRKLPLDLRRLTRISGVLPIDVPTLVQPKQ